MTETTVRDPGDDHIDDHTRDLIKRLSGGNDRFPFPMQRSTPFDPPPEYAELRSKCPVAPATLYGKNAWLLTKYDDVREALQSESLSADITHPHFPLTPGMKAGLEAAGGGNIGSFLKMDPPEHDDLRRMLTRDFMVKRVEAMRPRIQELVDGLIDNMLAGPQPADLFEVLAMPMPNTVICWLLGVPQSDHAFFEDRTTYAFKRDVPDDVRMEKTMELNGYVFGLVDQRIADPDLDPEADIISRLVHDQLRSGRLDRNEVHAMAMLMLVAGHETTGNMAALGTLALLQHPEQYEALGQDPALAPGAVEELMRYLTINDDPNYRFAKEDTVIGGRQIKAGDAVQPLTFSANRDEGHYDNPDALDIRRGVRDHLGFGYGIHQCLGQPLARVELQVFYETLARRIPTLRLAVPLEEVAFKTDADIYGVWSLPVTW
ncbi:cytochrome P450 [Streptomyces sp. GQFP]|uniref:cytochrome P450 n=1 Tax=Streptomyces sp. GQFP TaxID=2907545 RepID=UPI001F1EC977|nr:cytochrome P450 [Streptomyces sp. GQFP]UIX29279.1 cytochrome P450 [Streptomyces sp. GQFP]